MDDKRNRTVSMRLNDKEFAQLDEWRGKMQRGRWIRQRLWNNQPAVPPAINQEQWEKLSRIGSNINQIARALNMGNLIEIEEVRTALIELRTALINARPRRRRKK